MPKMNPKALCISTKRRQKKKPMCDHFLWCVEVDGSEEIFKASIHIVANQIAFESLDPNCMVSSGVIECWSAVLNHDEVKRIKEILGSTMYQMKKYKQG
ncbi:hypothetical protein L1987_37825 [Smallanthus sonchifolius]|uniref:Uncharacterized protein n=1 Tax=Smallanthus sonchifolius TaxID=185202 RepID=A0ACB9HIT7_9ASTR|nr:hypothetical protein L1987_37825 [Smallanthus sonchifolius]